MRKGVLKEFRISFVCGVHHTRRRTEAWTPLLEEAARLVAKDYTESLCDEHPYTSPSSSAAPSLPNRLWKKEYTSSGSTTTLGYYNFILFSKIFQFLVQGNKKSGLNCHLFTPSDKVYILEIEQGFVIQCCCCFSVCMYRLCNYKYGPISTGVCKFRTVKFLVFLLCFLQLVCFCFAFRENVFASSSSSSYSFYWFWFGWLLAELTILH
ncbi:hypothetical protein RHMOL_Rhmol03G0082900 [Rhododendron molle]|uniref:Uncharacterized protein n=1 Tax=Rhododendron molle TaxID=49168 RepID=A0ACC0PBH9_RHOML|nr:hypothetical protein RHMOL_Rhmol03G0082900 [Rhododendron molle]